MKLLTNIEIFIFKPKKMNCFFLHLSRPAFSSYDLYISYIPPVSRAKYDKLLFKTYLQRTTVPITNTPVHTTAPFERDARYRDDFHHKQ